MLNEQVGIEVLVSLRSFEEFGRPVGEIIVSGDHLVCARRQDAHKKGNKTS